LDKAPDAFRTISEVAEDLNVPQHVLRFWESRFAQIKPMKRAGGRRYYRPDDVDLLRGIHHLLYGEGYTIRGVQRILRDQGIKFVQTVWQAGAAQPEPMPEDDEFEEGVVEAAREDEDAEEAGGRPAMEPPVRVQAAPVGDLARDDLRRLQVTLFELSECRRLLDEAMKPN
jgi:DNA-binding transcriptional MerR regulator